MLWAAPAVQGASHGLGFAIPAGMAGHTSPWAPLCFFQDDWKALPVLLTTLEACQYTCMAAGGLASSSAPLRAGISSGKLLPASEQLVIWLGPMCRVARLPPPSWRSPHWCCFAGSTPTPAVPGAVICPVVWQRVLLPAAALWGPWQLLYAVVREKGTAWLLSSSEHPGYSEVWDVHADILSCTGGFAGIHVCYRNTCCRNRNLHPQLLHRQHPQGRERRGWLSPGAKRDAQPLKLTQQHRVNGKVETESRLRQNRLFGGSREGEALGGEALRRLKL